MRTLNRIFLALILLPLFTSCGLYKRFQSTPTPVADSLYREVSTDTASLARLSWRELFTDPALQQLIEEGLVKNTDLRVARLKITEAEATLMSSRLAYVPSLSFTPQATVGTGQGGAVTQNYQLSASASWEIDIFGKLTNAKRGAQAVVEQSKAYEQAVQTQLVATISNSYYSLLMLDRQLEISRQTAKNWAENVRVMQALKQAGRTTETAVAQAEASRLSVETSLLALQQQIYELENSLSTLLNRVPGKIERGKLNSQKFPEQISAGVPLEMVANRPDIRQREQALAQAYYVTNQARAAFYPSITLSGSGGWIASGTSILNPGSWLINAVGSLVQPIFNKGLNTARLKIAKAQQEEALLTFQQSLLDAGAEVNNALMQWQTARNKMQLSALQIKSLESAVRSSVMLMKNSDANYLEVLTAQQTLLNAQLSEVSDQFEEIQGVINLYHSLGGGVK